MKMFSDQYHSFQKNVNKIETNVKNGGNSYCHGHLKDILLFECH